MIRTQYTIHKGYNTGNYLYEYGSRDTLYYDENRSCIENKFAHRYIDKPSNCWKEEPEQLEYWQAFFQKKYEGRNIDIDRLDKLM